MKSRIEEVLSRILSQKHDAKIQVKFKEDTNEKRRDNHRASRADSTTRKGA